MKDVAIEHGFGKAVGHWQRKARALQQPAQIANLAHRQHAGGNATGGFRFGLRQTSAEFVQSLAAEQQAKEQPIGDQRAAALHQLANGIICPMQSQGVDHQILRFGLQVQGVIIGNRRKIWPKMWKSRHHQRICKRPVNFAQAILHFGDHFFLQEKGGRAGAVQCKGFAICQSHGQGWRHGLRT